MTMTPEKKRPLSTKQRLLAEREYITVKEFAALTGLAVGTLYNWNSAGIGPVATKFGRTVRYLASDVEVWMAVSATRGA